MSEFACRNGHPMRSGTLRCEECGASLYTMDGMTDRQIRKQEEYYRRRTQREMDDDFYDGT